MLKFEGGSDAIIIPKSSSVVVEDQWGGRGPWWRKMGWDGMMGRLEGKSGGVAVAVAAAAVLVDESVLVGQCSIHA